MKIPRYEQQVNAPSAPQFSQIADVRTNNLSVLADGLQDVYQDKLREQEEAKKTAYIQADNSIKMALDKAMFDLQERIQNGGSYATAEAEYQKAHDKAIKDFGSAFDADESGNTRLRSMSEYESMGMENILRLRNSISSRRKSDAASSINLRIAQANDEYIMAGDDISKREAAAKKITGALAGGASVGLYTGEEGKLKSMIALRSAEDSRLDYISVLYKNEPSKYLKEVELSKEVLGPEKYISHLAKATSMVDTVATVDSFVSYAKDPSSAQKPTQQSTDLFFNEKLLTPFINNEITQLDYEAGVVDVVNVSGKIPSQLENQMKTTLSMYKENMPADYKKAVISNARLVSKIYDSNPSVFTNEGSGLNKKDVIVSQSIINRIDAGVPEDIAVDETLKMASDKNYDAKYDEQVKKTYTNNDFKNYFTNQLNIDDVSWPLIQSKATDLFAMSKAMGLSDGDAKSSALKYLSKQYGDFNGVLVKYPPNKVTNIQDEKQWLLLAQKELNNFYETEFPSQVSGTTATKKFGKAILAGDEQTKKELENKINPSFALHYQTQEGALIPVFDRNGQKVRIAAEPKQENIIMPIFSSNLFGGTFIGPIKLGGYTKQQQKELEAGIKIQKQFLRGEYK